MYAPAARERVRIEGRSQSYFVLAVDPDGKVAHVADLHGNGEVEEIPFSQLAPCECGEPDEHLAPR